ncbi:MAG TPA: hypothetical protein PL001_13085 [Candidatus Kryptobacter bacterium]|nr:hypothetical protein [Candidatus Kryptobacter bacterium]
MQSLRESGSLMEDRMVLFIFRTNINEKPDYLRVKDSLLKRPGVRGCTIDLEDCDRVLRVECENIPVATIVQEVARQGFLCEELAD